MTSLIVPALVAAALTLGLAACGSSSRAETYSTLTATQLQQWANAQLAEAGRTSDCGPLPEVAQAEASCTLTASSDGATYQMDFTYLSNGLVKMSVAGNGLTPITGTLKATDIAGDSSSAKS